MISEVTCYKCKFCGKIWEERLDAKKCLDSHNLIYQIKKYQSSHDCWGNNEGYYRDTDIFFKEYDDALKYIGNNDDLKIKPKQLK